MNSVPIDFSERVWAICKCCKIPHACSCLKPSFVARQWNQAEEKKQLHFQFFIGSVAGKWKYGFRKNIDVLSLDKLMKFSNLMNTRVSWIGVREDEDQVLLKHDVVDVEKLLNFVSCLSNEPELNFRNPHLLDSYEGRAVFKWMEKRRFSELDLGKLTPDYHKLLENQRKSTEITIWGFVENKAFLKRRLRSGKLRRVSLFGGYKLPSAVLKQIVQNVLEDPDDYNTNAIDIFAEFDDSTREMMEEMKEKKLCSSEQEAEAHWTTAQIPYKFAKQKPILRVQSCSDDHWCITCE